jgi:bifunctional non-homologous end joining protein LigD
MADKPCFIAPELATLVDAPPERGRWLHEMKFDGYRLQLVIEGTKRARRVSAVTRGGHHWTDKFPAIVAAAKALKAKSAVIDGEAVVQDANGRSDFGALQAALGGGDTGAIVYFAFDLLHLDGKDLRDLPLIERKAKLKELLAGAAGAIHYSDHVEGGGAAFFKIACAHRLEGIVSKRAESPYRSGRGGDWLKTKCTKRQEFVVGGWLPRSDDPKGVGALLVGYYAGEIFKFAGKVGTGFNAKTRRELLAGLARSQRAKPAFEAVPGYERRAGARWADPKMVVEVEFTEFTADGMLRHPSFKGVRADKKPQDVVLEVPRQEPSPAAIEKIKPRWGRRKGA